MSAARALWLNSVRHLVSYEFLSEVVAAVARAWRCIFCSAVAIAAGACLSFFSIPYISFFCHWFLLLMPPLVAMFGSVLYVPFLVRAIQNRPASIVWKPVLRWAGKMYSIIGGVCVVMELTFCYGSSLALIVVSCGLLIVALCMSKSLFTLPIASAAVFFDPFNTVSARALSLHAYKMMRGELFGIAALLLSVAPFGYLCYQMIYALLQCQYVTLYGAYCLLHVANVLLWQISWLAFMVFYQQRKCRYLL